MKKFLGPVVAALIVIIFAELASGYFNAQRAQPSKPALVKFASNISQMLKISQGAKEKGQVKAMVDNANNPFIQNAPDKVLVKFHPFLDFTNVHILDRDMKKVVSAQNDFFGFRNKHNQYFGRRDPNDILIVMTGGSECAGYSHFEATILEKIKLRLSATTDSNIEILNLCMNSYVLAHEIQAFVHLAYRLKPNLVISHTGWNDAIYGLLLSQEFVSLGLNYNKWQERWLKPLYSEVKQNPSGDVFGVYFDENKPLIVDSFQRQITKYQKLVVDNGGTFILGIQPFNTVITPDSMQSLHKSVHSIMPIMAEVTEVLDHHIDFTKMNNKYSFVDGVHSSQKTAQSIADEYVSLIVSNQLLD